MNKYNKYNKIDFNNFFLRLCTTKSPTKSAFISDKGNCFHALEKCEGVKIKH